MLITACLLHNVAREEQFENHHLDHASLGAEKACRFLLEHCFDTKRQGKKIALQRQQSAVDFYEKMYHEVQEFYMAGKALISEHIT